jgi:hypothetical protein
VPAPRNPYLLILLLFLFVLLRADGDGTADVCQLCFALLLCMSGLYKSLGEVQLEICTTNHRVTQILCFLQLPIKQLFRMSRNGIDLVSPTPPYVLVTLTKAAWKVIEIQPDISNQGCRGDCGGQVPLVFTPEAVYIRLLQCSYRR